MKTIFSMLFLFFQLELSAQAVNEIKLYDGSRDTVQSLDLSKDDDIRPEKIPIAILNRNDNASLPVVKLILVAMGKNKSKASIINRQFEIIVSQDLTPSYVICNIQLSEESDKYETFRIYKENDMSSYYTLVIAPKPKADTAKKTTGSGAEANPKTTKTSSKHVSLDNKMTTCYYNDQKNKGLTADFSLVLKRDSLPPKGGKDTIYLTFDNFNLPNQPNDTFLIFSPINPLIISEKQWLADTDKYTYRIRLNNPFVNNIPDQETYGKIKIEGGNNTFHTVRFMQDTLKHNPGFMFLIAGSFDFDNVNPGFLGHANIWAPILTGRKKNWFGLNAGIMKIDYSKGGEGSTLNKDHYVFQNILKNPFGDTIGGSYTRQYNKFSYATKNTSWSFYAQPTYRILNGKRADIYANLHTELFVNKWKVNFSGKNLAQDTAAVITTSGIEFEKENRFSETNVIFDSSGVSTTLSVFLGAGLTFDIKPWKNATIFLQTVFGFAATDNQVLIINEKTGLPELKSETNGFYLTRCYLEQKLSNSLEAVLGYDCRGTLQNNSSPYYACYLGLNVSLDGLVTLLK